MYAVCCIFSLLSSLKLIYIINIFPCFFNVVKPALAAAAPLPPPGAPPLPKPRPESEMEE